MINKNRLGVLLIRTLLFFVAALVLGVVYDWPSVAIIAAAFTGGAALIQFAGWLYLRRTERTTPAKPEQPAVHGDFL